MYQYKNEEYALYTNKKSHCIFLYEGSIMVVRKQRVSCQTAVNDLKTRYYTLGKRPWGAAGVPCYIPHGYRSDTRDNPVPRWAYNMLSLRK
jgi:hypothetical protein